MRSFTTLYSFVGSGTEFVFTPRQQRPEKPQQARSANTYYFIVGQMLHFDTRTLSIEGIDAVSVVALCLYNRQYIFCIGLIRIST